VKVTKRCPRCGETLPLEAFSVNADGRLRTWCRACEASARRERYVARPEVRARAIEQATGYRERHREELAARQRVWERENEERRKAQRRERRRTGQG
jgi:hypothetical protein